MPITYKGPTSIWTLAISDLRSYVWSARFQECPGQIDIDIEVLRLCNLDMLSSLVLLKKTNIGAYYDWDVLS